MATTNKDQEKMAGTEFEKFFEKYELKRVRTEFFGRIITLVIASISLIAALAWDDALKHLFENLFGNPGSLHEQMYYAVVMTAIAAVVSVWLGKLFVKREKKKLKLEE